MISNKLEMTDLKLNYPSVDTETTAINNFIASCKSDFNAFLKFPNYQGSINDLLAASNWLKISSIYQTISDVIICNSANHTLSCILQTLKAEHQHIITEPFIYPAFREIALNNGFKLFPSEFDNEGLTIEGLEKTIQQTKSKLIYLQPTIQNPTCVVMPLDRRKQIAELAKQKNILIIEDDAYRFLHPNPPLRFLDLIPENTFHIYSLSKPFNPLIKTSYLVLPKSFTNSVTDKVRHTSSGHSALLGGLATYVLGNGILDNIIDAKRTLAKNLQREFLPILNGLSYITFPTSFHIWITLPDRIKDKILTKELLSRNIILPGGGDFLADTTNTDVNYIRIALGAERDPLKIKNALTQLMELIQKV